MCLRWPHSVVDIRHLIWHHWQEWAVYPNTSLGCQTCFGSQGVLRQNWSSVGEKTGTGYLKKQWCWYFKTGHWYIYNLFECKCHVISGHVKDTIGSKYWWRPALNMMAIIQNLPCFFLKPVRKEQFESLWAPRVEPSSSLTYIGSLQPLSNSGGGGRHAFPGSSGLTFPPCPLEDRRPEPCWAHTPTNIGRHTHPATPPGFVRGLSAVVWSPASLLSLWAGAGRESPRDIPWC